MGGENSWGGKAQRRPKVSEILCCFDSPYDYRKKLSTASSPRFARNLRLKLVLKSVNESSSFYSYQPRNDSKSHEDSVLLIIRSNDLTVFSHKLVSKPVKLVFFVFQQKNIPATVKVTLTLMKYYDLIAISQ